MNFSPASPGPPGTGAPRDKDNNIVKERNVELETFLPRRDETTGAVDQERPTSLLTVVSREISRVERREDERQNWSSPLEYFLSCIAMSVRHRLLGLSVIDSKDSIIFHSTSSLCCSG